MSLGRATAHGPPPPPHDPADRIAVGEVMGWQIRVYDPGSPLYDCCAERELLHLQLWHPGREVSALTPSLLTAGCFELYPLQGWKLPVADPWITADVVWRAWHLPFPGPVRLLALERWFLRRPDVAAGARAHG